MKKFWYHQKGLPFCRDKFNLDFSIFCFSFYYICKALLLEKLSGAVRHLQNNQVLLSS